MAVGSGVEWTLCDDDASRIAATWPWSWGNSIIALDDFVRFRVEGLLGWNGRDTEKGFVLASWGFPDPPPNSPSAQTGKVCSRWTAKASQGDLADQMYMCIYQTQYS